MNITHFYEVSDLGHILSDFTHLPDARAHNLLIYSLLRLCDVAYTHAQGHGPRKDFNALADSRSLNHGR